jgi:G6PDH family F420-dependent oxidoreductase
MGSGENLNEHVVGEGWPSVDVRQAMLEEAVTIIRQLHTGELITWEGEYFRVDSARIWDPAEVPIGLAVSGEQSVERFAPLADHLIAVEPKGELIQQWEATKPGSRKIGQLPICWGPDKDEAVALAHDQFRWFSAGWPVNSELPTPASFAAATQLVKPDDVAQGIACGPDLDELAESARPYLEAGFTDLAIVQVGDELQKRFLDEAAGPLLEKLRAL